MAEVETRTYQIEHLRGFGQRVLVHFGVPEEDARQAIDVLITADLRGIESHGIGRLRSYVDLMLAKKINPRPEMKIVRQTPSTATIDGDNGLGLVIGPKSYEIAMRKAEDVGSGWVSVRNSNHFGIAGYYPLEALKRDMIGWAMTNSTKMVAPLWGAERMLGTNPLAIAFPAKREPPVVIDMATSVVAYGKIEMAKHKQQSIPHGWAIDVEGRDTVDPAVMIGGGALLPLGLDRDHGCHKGYCLATMVDVLSCVLSGANWGPFAPPDVQGMETPERRVGKGVGHFFGAMRIDAFIDLDEFKSQVDEWIHVMRATQPAPDTNGPLIPGDPEHDAEQIRRQQGIPLIMPVVEELREISVNTRIPFD